MVSVQINMNFDGKFDRYIGIMEVVEKARVDLEQNGIRRVNVTKLSFSSYLHRNLGINMFRITRNPKKKSINLLDFTKKLQISDVIDMKT